MARYFSVSASKGPWDTLWPWEYGQTRGTGNLIVSDVGGVLIDGFKRSDNDLIVHRGNAEKTETRRQAVGILADWLDDNRDECLAFGSDPDVLAYFVENLRAIFNTTD